MASNISNGAGPRPRRRPAILLYTLPPLFCLWLYWYGLQCWFQQDDFAWLSLHTQVYDWRSFLTGMFAPMAQGTIRPWSERGFFLLFYKLFEANALPYRILVFATQIANLLLLSFIVLRLTRSRIASLAAPVLWTANSALSTAMSWTSDYNEIQCAFFLLAAFALYLEDRYWLQLVVFVLGFGSLELNVVYPALVLACVLTTGPTKQRILKTLPLFAISIAYFGMHSAVAPRAESGPYALHLDLAIFQTFFGYWQSALVPSGWTAGHKESLTPAFTGVFTAILLGHTAVQVRRRRYLPVFLLLWFPITLGPLLPLRDHISDYYLTVPALGLAMLWTDAFTAGAPAFRYLPAAAALLYVGLQVPQARAQTHWFFDRSHEVYELVSGVREARRLHPAQTLLLADITPGLAAFAIAHSPFHALDIAHVYLAPQNAIPLALAGALGPVQQFILPPGPTLHGLAAGQIQVYSISSGRLRNITSLYERLAPQQISDKAPQRVDVAVPLLAYLLGSSWYPLEGDHRWMPRQASLRMGGPSTPDEKLTLSGFCPPELTASGALGLTVLVNGEKLPETKIEKSETSFSRTFSLPPDAVGRDYVEVALEVGRIYRAAPGDRELGLAFGIFEIH